MLSTPREPATGGQYLHSLFMDRKQTTVSAGPLFDTLKDRGAQAAFARKLNISIQVLSNWRKRGIPRGNIPEVAHAMSLPSTDHYFRLAEHWGKNGVKRTNGVTVNIPQSEAEKFLALVKAFLDTDSETQVVILKAATSLSESHGKTEPSASRRKPKRR